MPWAKRARIDAETGVPKHEPFRETRIQQEKLGRSYKGRATLVRGRPGNLTSLAIECLFPWSIGSYPGHRRAVLAILPRPVTWGAVQHWKTGRKRMPVWACEALADYLERRAAADLALAGRLREAAREGVVKDELLTAQRVSNLARHGKPIHLYGLDRDAA